MGFREHVLDFQTAVNIPLRHIVIFQHLYTFRCKSLGGFSLSGVLHDLECLFRLNAFVQQISHNAVTGTDYVRNGTGAVIDQVFGISKPYVSTVGKSADLQEVAEFFRFGVQQHLNGEAGSHFRNAKASRLAVDFFWCNAQNRSIGTHLNDLGICCGNIVNQDTSGIFQVLIHSRYDMPQFVQFQNGIVERMEVEVCCQNFRFGIVRRVLYRREVIYIIIAGDNNHAAGGLTSCSFDTRTANRQ